ncbi:feruloyl esteras-like protein B precursor [Plenodomus tracheiphilus IPT5]|uniref:Carboxylic ester hydrolase n=1 Tax=Plenodomus tracheiphilus IPT5 TaxID=1408161 RepID=A0A6A7B0T2_9PLEO|nr:feruloyl esteras-like protein B precursor [Plenodomus tracheiphilus IPT5]
MGLTLQSTATFFLPVLGLTKSVIAAQCGPSTFQNITLFGGKILDIKTVTHSNLTLDVPVNQNHYSKNVTGLNACEVLIKYTHPGYDDTINTVVWLPAAKDWTGRFLGAGGGGFRTGVETNDTLPWAASEGFAVVSTDGGHTAEDAVNIEKWGLSSPGNVNWALLQDFASTALDDAATLGKAAAHAYYGRAPDYSYWNGCSTGGRQGYQMAQKYPEQYDGILATAPGIYWNELMMQLFWPQAVMNDLEEYPTFCELEAINDAAIEACDELDGLKDGIIGLPKECKFDPNGMVGKQYRCTSTNETTTITKAAAIVAEKTWQGPTSPEGDFLWHGTNPGASFAMTGATTCTDGVCTGAPFLVAELWIKYFIKTNPDYKCSGVNTTTFETLFDQSVQRYNSILGTSDTNLNQFRKAGGKLLSWHGLADTCIAPDATAEYTRRIHERDPNASDYYRYFEAPGVDHCGGGLGWYPGNALKSLIDWVEKGIAPETLDAETQGDAKARKANLCLWPKHLVYVAGDAAAATSFECR